MKNRLISIGWLGLKKCYLNVDTDDAIERYCKSENMTREDFESEDIQIDEFDFDDEFDAYSVWS